MHRKNIKSESNLEDDDESSTENDVHSNPNANENKIKFKRKKKYFSIKPKSNLNIIKQDNQYLHKTHFKGISAFIIEETKVDKPLTSYNKIRNLSTTKPNSNSRFTTFLSSKERFNTFSNLDNENGENNRQANIMSTHGNRMNRMQTESEELVDRRTSSIGTNNTKTAKRVNMVKSIDQDLSLINFKLSTNIKEK